jgi:hypothetical protein
MGKAIVIEESEVSVSRRGRTASFDPDLLDDLGSLKAGKAMDLSPYFGEVTEQTDKAKVGQVIRKHWKAVRSDECRIDFGNGRPQVRVKR